MLGGLWAVFLVISLWEIDDLRVQASHQDVLAESSLVLDSLSAISQFSRGIGLHDARAKVLAVTDDVRRRHSVETPAQPLSDEPAIVATLPLDQQPFEPEQKNDVVFAAAKDQKPKLELRFALKPERVLLVGASSIQFYLGAELARQFETYEGVTVERFGKLSTGLARPDLFDWFAEVKARLSANRADVVVGMFGGNDAQNIDVGDKTLIYETPEWDAEYRRRVSEMVTLIRSFNAQAVMLGMPTMRSKPFNKKMEHVNALTQEATEGAGGIYLSTWDISADANGNYKPTVTFNGETGLSRLPDGVHHSRLGAEYVSSRLRRRFERHFILVPKEKTLATAQPFAIESAARKKWAPALAYVPQDLRPDEKVPVVYLLHGAEGTWEDCSEQAHEILQKLAATERLVIVTPDGDPFGWYLDAPKIEGGNIETFFTDELVPKVEQSLPVSATRGIFGLSMGGHGALTLALKHPGLFTSVSSMSGAVDLSRAANRPTLVQRLGPYEQKPELWQKHSALHLFQKYPSRGKKLQLLITTGAEDPLWTEGNRALHDALTTLKVPHLYEESEGGHTWTYWRAQLPRHLKFHSEQLHRAAETAQR